MTIFRTNPPISTIFAGAVVLLAGLAGCAPTTAPSAVAVGPVSPGAARIWFYRDYEPSVSLGLATVTLNGGVVGHAQPDGSAFYRDIAPGRYAVGVVNSAIGLGPGGTVELRPGEQAYVKITALDGLDRRRRPLQLVARHVPAGDHAAAGRGGAAPRSPDRQRRIGQPCLEAADLG